MAVLKVRCPECDASIRQTIDAVDEPTDFPVTCPKCSAEFTATAEPEAAPARDAKKSGTVSSAAKRNSKTDVDDAQAEVPRSKKKLTEKEAESPRSKKKQTEDGKENRRAKKDRGDDEDETPRKGKKKGKKQEEVKSKLPLILAGVGVLLLLIGGGVAAFFAFDSKKETARNDAPASKSGSSSSSKGPSSGKNDAKTSGPSDPATSTSTDAGTSSTPSTPGNPGGPGLTPGGPMTPGGPGLHPGGPMTPGGPGLHPGGPMTPGGPGLHPGGPMPPGGPGLAPGAPMPPGGPGLAPMPPGGPMMPGTGPGTGPGAPTGPKKNPEQAAEIPPLPPPPKLRLNSGEERGGTMTSEEKAGQAVPLAPDEDPFVRAKTFRAEALPQLPKLPPVKERPVLALDSGGHNADIRNVFFTPGNDRIITVSADKTVRIWDVKTASTINTFRFPAGPGQEGSLNAAAMSSKGRLAVVGSPLAPAKAGAPAQYIIFILDAEKGTLVRTLTAAHDVMSLHFSSDGNRLAAGSLRLVADARGGHHTFGTVQVFDVNTGNQVWKNDMIQEGMIMEVRFNPEPKSQLLAILLSPPPGPPAPNDKWLVHVLDMKAPAKGMLFDATAAKANTMAWSNDGLRLAVGGNTGEIVIFDTENRNAPGRTLPKITVKDKDKEKEKEQVIGIWALQYLPGDNGLLVGGTSSWAGIVAPDTGTVKVPFTHHSNVVSAVTSSADGKLVATCGGNQRETYIWNASSGKIVARLSGMGKMIYGIGWSRDGKSIGWGTNSKTEDVDGYPIERIFRLDEFGPGGPAFQTKFQQAQDNDDIYTVIKTLAINSKGQVTITLLIQVDKQKPYLLIMPGEDIYSASVLPGRGKAVIGGSNGLYIFDLQTKEHKTLTAATGVTFGIAPSPDGKYFVTGSSDQTIRIWQPELDEPVLSIFIAGPDWVAWTPQGYYACSPHGEKLLSWQVNSGNNKLPQIFPAARFRPSMYQPAILKYLIPAGRVEYAMAMAQKFDKALLTSQSVADIMPPEASFDASITDDMTIDADTFTVKARAKGSSKQPVTALRLMVDGRPFQGREGIKHFATPGETAEASWAVPLSPGPHTLSVIADSAVSKGMSKQVTITRKGEIPKPNLYVLAMGISDYPGSMKLHYAASDATILARALQLHCKGVFAHIEIRLVTDKDATKKGVREGLDWLASKMTAKDVGIVSFSGHGTRDENNKFYLVTYDIDIKSKDPTKTCFSGEDFKKSLDNMPGRLIAILDACHSGDVAERVAPTSNDSLAADLSSEESGVIVMCASLGRELSSESVQSKAGFYTLGLCEGLEGHADINEDGYVYIDELDLYAYARVRQLSHGMQNSTISIPAGIRPFPLAKVEKKP